MFVRWMPTVGKGEGIIYSNKCSKTTLKVKISQSNLANQNSANDLKFRASAI